MSCPDSRLWACATCGGGTSKKTLLRRLEGLHLVTWILRKSPLISSNHPHPQGGRTIQFDEALAGQVLSVPMIPFNWRTPVDSPLPTPAALRAVAAAHPEGSL